jgi:hypothetical protein
VEQEDLVTGWGENRQAVKTLEALEDPAQRGSDGRLVDLIGDRLAGGGQLRAQAVCGQAVDQQAEHHDTTEGHDALGLFQEDGGGQEERVLEEGKAALDPTLILGVDADERLVGQGDRVEHSGGHQKAGATERFLLDLVRIGRGKLVAR